MSTIRKEDIGIEGAIKKLNIKKDDVILYLGGRIDDDNLYPFDYINYLNHKIKELNPKKASLDAETSVIRDYLESNILV